MGATLVYEHSGAKLEPFINPQDARTFAVQMAANLTVVKGERLGQLTANGKYTNYDDGGAGGAEVAKAIAVYSFVTDASGNVFYGTDVPTTGPTADPQPTAEVYWKGDFLKSELTAAAVIGSTEPDDFGWRELGTGTDTIIHIP